VGRAGFSVLVGPEEMMAECVLLGIDGGVNGGSNLFPSLYVSLYDAASRGDLPKVRELQSRVLDVSQRIYSAVTYASGYLQGIKCAASLLGLCSGELGPPYEPLAESLRESIRSHLVALGALRAG
jgi:4-hydroxy-tetrahydrodipicolinate synthase